MRVVLQRVLSAQLRIKNQLHCQIGAGLVLLVGFGVQEEPTHLAKMSQKIAKLRLFAAGEQGFATSVVEESFEVLSVPQFTLFAEVKKGRRPSFSEASPSEQAQQFYADWLVELHAANLRVKSGVFGANMQIQLINDGPVTFWLDSRQLFN